MLIELLSMFLRWDAVVKFGGLVSSERDNVTGDTIDLLGLSGGWAEYGTAATDLASWAA